VLPGCPWPGAGARDEGSADIAKKAPGIGEASVYQVMMEVGQ
jgi:hypothetical protein